MNRMRVVGCVLGLSLLIAYFVVFGLMYQPNSVAAKKIDSLPMTDKPMQVAGNGTLRCLILSTKGSAEVVDASNSIQTMPILAPENATRFLASAFTPKGISFLADDKLQLTRVGLNGKVDHSRPLKVDGTPLGIAVEESTKILWFATKRDKPTVGAIFVYAVSLQNGKVIGSANIGPQGDSVEFYTGDGGAGTVMVVDRAPGAFLFQITDKSIASHPLKSDEKVMASVFDGPDPLLGLRSGQVAKYDGDTGTLKEVFDTGSIPVTSLSLQGLNLGIGHGESPDFIGAGSTQTLDLRTRTVRDECGTRAVVSAASPLGTRLGFIYGLETGQIRFETKERGCTALDVPERQWHEGIRLIACQWPVCLVVSAKTIQRIQFPGP